MKIFALVSLALAQFLYAGGCTPHQELPLPEQTMSLAEARKGFKTTLLPQSRPSEELEQAKLGNILSHTTLSLFYATDFADQLENIILPGLKAGFMVLEQAVLFHASSMEDHSSG